MSSAPRVRMSPATRRAQLLDLGVTLLATRSLDELSIDLLAEEAGISRGLLYHYFGNKQDFHEAVVRRAVQDLIDVTAPVDDPDLITRLAVSLDHYVAYVEANRVAYVSIVRAASGNNDTMREIYQSARNALTDRIFEAAGPEGLAEYGIVDSPGVRLMVRGWAALVEQVVLDWIEDPRGVPRAALLESLTGTLALTLSAAPGTGTGQPPD